MEMETNLTDRTGNGVRMTRDAAWGDDGIDSSHLNSPAGHAPERIGWNDERREHDAQEGVQEGKHPVDSPQYLGKWR
jgi:hypothetical protein